MYKDDFKKFVSDGDKNKYYVGIGNPNAQILIVGQESAIAEDNTENIEQYKKNANEWQNHIENNSCQTLSYPITENHIFRKEKIWGKNTWSKYQKLGNYIFEKEEKPYYIDFLENVFTTEINDSPSKTNSTANRSSLNERKILFKESEFIQNFPVVVLACSHYIRNNKNVREIDEIFRVRYEEGFPSKIYNKTNWFYSHYNDDKTKLVIHTRQLSGYVKSDLLKDMAELIRQHLKKINN